MNELSLIEQPTTDLIPDKAVEEKKLGDPKIIPRTTDVLREFSKENSQEERDQLAHEIREKRRERHTQLDDAKETQETSKKTLENLDANIEKLGQELASIPDTFYSKIVDFLKIKKIQKQLQTLQNDRVAAEAENETSEAMVSSLSLTKDHTPEQFKESKQLIEDFYAKKEKEWSKLPYKASDIKKYFDPEYLKTLPIGDYTTLLKRFGGDMVTHVTRQGIRDHVGMMEHSVGQGRAWNGFKDLTKDGKIEHNLGLRILDEVKDEKIIQYFGLENIPTRERALSKLREFTDSQKQHYASSFVDFHSVHFAVKEVADSFYGAESGNEIFIAYPSYVMAANYFHRGDPHIPAVGANYNDVWVYVEEDDEMSIDAGIAFIPKDAQVNPETGSKYEINANGEAAPDEVYITEIQTIIARPGFDDFAKKASKALGGMSGGVVEDYMEGNYRYESKEQSAIIGTLIEEAKKIVPGIDDKTIKVLMDYDFLNTSEIGSVRNIRQRLTDLGMFYRKTETTVSSQEYWEDYFSKNPTQRPSKIVYYEGEDPTRALNDWKRQNGIGDKEVVRGQNNEFNQGIDGLEVPPEVSTEMSRFRSIAEKVINDYYDQKIIQS